jgi:hypothetical protein
MGQFNSIQFTKNVQGHTNIIWNVEHNTKQHPQTDKYNKSGVYQMKCLDCPLKYIRQTGRIFLTGYKELIQAIRNNN